MEEWKKDVVWVVLMIIIVVGIYLGFRFVFYIDLFLVIVVSGLMEFVFYCGDVVFLKGVIDLL